MSVRILIIEAEEPRLRLLDWGLRGEGLEVTTVAELPAGAPELRPDVIVMNTGMPGNGKRVWIQSLRYLVPGVRVVDLVSDHRGDEDYDTGADAYVHKPFRIDELRTTMAAILGGDLAN
jgi:DNA-binding response OmpR family regulator